MPNRLEYIQQNLKAQAQQDTVAGICRSDTVVLPMINGWEPLTFVFPQAENLRVWKDSGGTVHLAGGFSINSVVPGGTANNWAVTTLTATFRPKATIYAQALYWDNSAAAYIPGALLIVTAAGAVSVTTPAISPGNADYGIVNLAWTAA